jgi:hypothetical protein
MRPAEVVAARGGTPLEGVYVSGGGADRGELRGQPAGGVAVSVSERRSRVALLLALALGILSDRLVRAPLWGLNVALGLTAVVAAAFALSLRPAGRGGSRHAGPARWPWVAAAAFALMWAVRDAPLLLAANLLAALGLVCLPLAGVASHGLRRAGVTDLAAAVVGTAWRSATGGAEALRSATSGSPGRPAARRAAAVGAGLLLAAPLVLLFGALFASADPLFRGALDSLLGFDVASLLSHVALAGFFAWVSAGYLWAHAVPRPVRAPVRPAVRLGRTPIVTVLATTAAVFALFVAVQAGSLFGGESFVRNRTGLTYAEYARRGFFEMVFASALALPLVYAAPFAAGGPAGDRSFAWLRAFLGAQLALAGLVLASALWRVGLYVRTYGLTEDRLYGLAVIVWIAATIGVFAATVLRGRPGGAAFGTTVAAAAVLALLNLVNPAALVARYNLERPNARGIDVAHLASLGADAAPVLAARLDALDPAGRCAVASAIVRKHGTPAGDWRGWNRARARAARVAARLESFARSCGAPEPGSELPGDHGRGRE